MKLTGKKQKDIDAEKEKQDKDVKNAEMRARLVEIDAATIRPLRAIAAGTNTDADAAKLKELEDEAIEIRKKLKE